MFSVENDKEPLEKSLSFLQESKKNKVPISPKKRNFMRIFTSQIYGNNNELK